MTIEEVKQWQCGNGLAVAVNDHNAMFQTNEWMDFEEWASDPANQPVTDLDGIFNYDQVKEVWEWFNNRDTMHGQWVKVYDIHYLSSFSEFYNYFSNFKTRRRLVLAEAAICNTYSGPAPNETNVSPRLYTHAELLAFGEKVKERLIELADSRVINSGFKGKWYHGYHAGLNSINESIQLIDLNKIEIK